MNIPEALTFLELSPAATEAEVRQRLKDKLAFFENLSETAASDFLRRVNTLHAAKVKKMQEDFRSMKYQLPQEALPTPEIPLPPVEEVAVPEADIADTMPLPLTEKNIRQRPADEPAGWLILHTENIAARSFPLLVGKTWLGRKQQAGTGPFMLVEDAFVSRVHAVIYVDGNEPFEFYVDDSDVSNGGKASTNGTFINGNLDRIRQKTKIADDDTIQVGTTKFVFKTNTAAIEELIKEVSAKAFVKTVAIAP